MAAAVSRTASAAHPCDSRTLADPDGFLDTASLANSAAAIPVTAAVAITALGASASRINGPTTTQPSAAPVRSAAYSALTCAGKRVRASETTTPLNTKGTDKAA